ncbi:hypothetical protein [Nonomuraea lactucae]|uniref:hypothetical protein n=1 Tax=Nonomuraea lactucae TaxID=2249762 RepID=UPI000DE45F25|nr:hypothetical protein [Nonomuraea lactucae]
MIDTDPDPQPRYVWLAKVGCEGGPLLVCEVDAFAAWGGAVLTPEYELDPGCDLSRANAVLYPSDEEEFETGLVRFGADDQHTGLVWEMDGQGLAEVATSGDDGFLVMRSWVRNTDAPHRYAAGPAARNKETPTAELDLQTGRVAVVWAPVGATEVGPFSTIEETTAGLRALTEQDSPVKLDLDDLRGVGTLLRVRPGRYQVSRGLHEGTRGRYAPFEEQYGPPVPGNDDDWSCRWIRFARSGGEAAVARS